MRDFEYSDEDVKELDFYFSLGGIEKISINTDLILGEYGIGRSIFHPHDIARIKYLSKLMGRGLAFDYTPTLSISAQLCELLEQAKTLQQLLKKEFLFGAMIRQLIGAQLDLLLGQGKVKHHGANVADGPTSRAGDFLLDKVVIHVTSAPTEALVRKCQTNVEGGLHPVIITLPERTEVAMGLLANAQLDLRVDVFDMLQFLTSNVYEHSKFKVMASKDVLARLLSRYNDLVAQHETDPVLRIDLGKGKG